MHTMKTLCLTVIIVGSTNLSAMDACDKRSNTYHKLLALMPEPQAPTSPQTPLHAASMDERLENLGYDLTQRHGPLLYEDPKRDLNLALCIAARYGKTDDVRKALKQGAEVWAYNNRALRYAFSPEGNTETVTTLIAYGADINALRDEPLPNSVRTIGTFIQSFQNGDEHIRRNLIESLLRDLKNGVHTPQKMPLVVTTATTLAKELYETPPPDYSEVVAAAH